MSPSEEGNKVSWLPVNIRDSNDDSCEISITLYKIYYIVNVKIIIWPGGRSSSLLVCKYLEKIVRVELGDQNKTYNNFNDFKLTIDGTCTWNKDKIIL